MELNNITFKGVNYFRPEDLKFTLPKSIREAFMKEMEDTGSQFYKWFCNFDDEELNTPFSLFLRAYGLDYREKHVEAQNYYKKAYNIDKTNTTILLYTARSYDKSNLKDTALNTLNDALTIKKTADLYYEKGKLLYDYEKDYISALESFSKALRINKKHIEALKGKSDSLYKLNRHSEGKECLEKVHKLTKIKEEFKLTALKKGKKVEVELIDTSNLIIEKKKESSAFYIARYSNNMVVLGIKLGTEKNWLLDNVIKYVFDIKENEKSDVNSKVNFKVILPAVFYWNEYENRGHLIEKGKVETIEIIEGENGLQKEDQPSISFKNKLASKPAGNLKRKMANISSGFSKTKIIIVSGIVLVVIVAILTPIVLSNTLKRNNNNEKTTGGVEENIKKSENRAINGIITPKGAIITDIGEISNESIDDNNKESKWLEAKGKDRFEVKKEEVKITSQTDRKEEKFIITIPKVIWNKLKDSGVEPIQDNKEYLKGQAVKEDGTFMDVEIDDYDFIRIESTPTKRPANIGKNIRTFFTGEDISGKKLSIGIFKGQAILFYSDGEEEKNNSSALDKSSEEEEKEDEEELASLNEEQTVENNSDEESSQSNDNSELEGSKKKWEEEKLSLQKQINQLETDKKDLQEQIDELKNKKKPENTNKNNDEIDRLKNKISNIEREKKELNKKISKLQKQVNSLNKNNGNNLKYLSNEKIKYESDNIPYYREVQIPTGTILELELKNNKYYIDSFDYKGYLPKQFNSNVDILNEPLALDAKSDNDSEFVEISNDKFNSLKKLAEYKGIKINKQGVRAVLRNNKGEEKRKVTIKKSGNNSEIGTTGKQRSDIFGDTLLIYKGRNRKVEIVFEKDKIFIQPYQGGSLKYAIVNEKMVFFVKEGGINPKNFTIKNVALGNFRKIIYKKKEYWIPMYKSESQGNITIISYY